MELLQKTLSFLQDFLDEAKIDLTVSPLTEDDFEAIVTDGRSVLNWLKYFGHFCSPNDNFHMGFRLKGISHIDGAALGLYVTNSGEAHIFLIESLIRGEKHHPLSGRLTTFVIVAVADYMLNFEESKGVYMIEPHPELISFYEKFGFNRVDGNGVVRMYASVESLQQTQVKLMEDVFNELL